MGQLFNRLRDFARTQMRTDTRVQDAERTISSDDDELRRIIEELHADYTEGRHHDASANASSDSRTFEASSLPSDVLKAHTMLNVSVGSSIDDIKKSYRRSIATWHPDRFVAATAEEQQRAHNRARDINAAYVTLRNHYGFR